MKHKSEVKTTIFCKKRNRSLTVFGMRRTGKIANRQELRWVRNLESEATLAVYLTDILWTNDTDMLVSALRDIARSQGMTKVAKSAGITREALYKALRPGSAPRFETVRRVCLALGVRLVAEAVSEEASGE